MWSHFFLSKCRPSLKFPLLPRPWSARQNLKNSPRRLLFRQSYPSAFPSKDSRADSLSHPCPFSGLSQWYGASEHEPLPTDDLFYALAPQPVLEKQIGESILSPEEMADTASVTLHDLRRKIRQTEDSIRTKLDNIIKNSTTNKFLQDAVVSLRNGRYVVPVRAEYRGEVGGVIHDVSSTGATLFVEPTAVVEANARIMQLRAQEQEEITRILSSFSAQVGSLEPQFSYSYEAMLQIDLLLAKARLATEQNAFRPAVSDKVCFRLNRARHPLRNFRGLLPVRLP